MPIPTVLLVGRNPNRFNLEMSLQDSQQGRLSQTELVLNQAAR